MIELTLSTQLGSIGLRELRLDLTVEFRITTVHSVEISH